MESPIQHPSAAALQSFGLGLLDNAAAEALLSHLSDCADCRDKVASQPGDSFLASLRAAHGPPSNTPAPAKTPPISIVPPATSSSASIPGLPRELAEHPKYRIERELGRGGMGVVYLARDTILDRFVVLKIVAGVHLERPGVLRRFLEEIRSAARLDHPNVVKALAGDPIGNQLVFVMEFVDGIDLHRLVKERGPLRVNEACNYACQTALGLQHAHEKGMVHRDVKPHNLMLTRGKVRQVKILDFGLAKATSEKGEELGLTADGQMVGTPDYIAPEQATDAAAATIRADIYSLGCTLYYLLTGEPPFRAKTAYEVVLAHKSAEIPQLDKVRADVPPELAMVVAKLMSKDPSDRYQTPAEVAHALRPFFKPRSGVKVATRVPTPPPPPETMSAADSSQVQVYNPDVIPPPRRAVSNEDESDSVRPHNFQSTTLYVGSASLEFAGRRRKSAVALIVVCLLIMIVAGLVTLFVLVANTKQPGKGRAGGSSIGLSQGKFLPPAETVAVKDQKDTRQLGFAENASARASALAVAPGALANQSHSYPTPEPATSGRISMAVGH
jgi:serine/threonine protein kinase